MNVNWKLLSFVLMATTIMTSLSLTMPSIPAAIAAVIAEPNTVNSAAIIDGQVKTTDLANGNVTTAKIANNAVNSAKIADGQVRTADIANLNVTNAKIINGAINTAKLANNAVTNTKLATDSVTGDKILNGTITDGDLATDSVSGDELAGVTFFKFATAVVDPPTLAPEGQAVFTITVPGVQRFDRVIATRDISAPGNPPGTSSIGLIIVEAGGTDTDTLILRVRNESTATVDFSYINVNLLIFRPG